ncbi:MAG: BatA domain-containing protein [Planctomycetaceae bacterium]|nr:BatA domain-containing protein [Planctomycetaceae bacterium]
MQFIHQPLTWAFLIALVPLLIHLINMMRHRRVQWAAMEFLLASYKKHRKWVWMKQLLLLLARMAAVALIVAMLAQLKTRDQWLAIFGGRATHHYVLLDDSYSMSDRVAGASAMDAAKQVVAAIVDRAKQEDSPQKLTLIRFSRAKGAEGRSRPPGGTSTPATGDISTESTLPVSASADLADFNAEPIDSQFDLALERKARSFEPTQLAIGPQGALAVLKPLLAGAKDETSIVYLLSDFRRRDWDSPAELRDSLQELKRAQADVHLVNCARASDPNLGLVAVEPADETRAAGVPLFVNVSVKNHGSRAASKVQLKVQSTFYPPDDLSKTQPDKLTGLTEELATLLIDTIGPGETVSRRVQVYFPQPGKHVIEASLPEDSVDADNRRWAVIDFPDGERTLLIDGTDDQLHAYYLDVAFHPLQRSNTGIRPETKPASFLRDTTLDALSAYSTVYLLDVPRLDPKAIETLEAFVRRGGGLAIFTGPQTNVATYNTALYRDGQGVLPVPLGAEAELPPIIDPAEPDLALSGHPIFSFLLAGNNPLVRGVRVDRFRKLADGWKPDPANPVEIIGRLRDKSPLVVEKKFGAGTVLQFTTSCAPLWNDLAKNPSFVVVMLKMQSYLAKANRLDDPRLVGAPLDLELESAKYRSDVAFVVPGEKPGSRRKFDRQALATERGAPEAGAATITASLIRSAGETNGDADTSRRGVYEAWPISTKGEIDLRRWAFNVDPDEGDLTGLESTDLLGKLDPVKVAYHQADQYEQEEISSTGYNLSYLIMTLLVLLLIGEQLLAYSASYHVTPGAVR